MATGPTHRGWLTKPNEGILAAVYNGAMPGTTLLATNTALDGVLLGTPVTPALAVDSMVISDLVASGDILVAANNGGNSQAWLWVDASASTMTLYAAGVEQIRTAVGSLVLNEGSADVDFRVETNGIQYAIYADGGKDALVLGSNTDTSSADQLITISRAARSATTTVNYYDFIIAPAGAVTVPSGTTALVATARFNEPNITNNGTLTEACTVYIAGAPTEASSNYSLFIDTGSLRLDGDLDLRDGAVDILMKAGTAAALEIATATIKFYALDTRATTVAVLSHALDVNDYTLASAATAVVTMLDLAAHTLNYTGTTQVTSECITASIGARSLVGGSAVTVDKASSLKLVAPIEGANVTLTAASALRIGDSGSGTPTNQYGIFIETLTAGATADYAIWVAGANAVHLGTAGTATGLLEVAGATSGTVTVTVAAAAGTWTMTLPTGVAGTGGFQLTDASGDGVCSWSGAGSLREFKEISGEHDAQDALDKILGTKVYDFHYKEGMGTQDRKTRYVGVIADEAPWAMHYGGRVVNPVNSLGFTVLGFQAMAKRIADLESKLAVLQG